MGGGGDRRKDDHNMGGRLQRVEGGGRDVWHGKGLEADTHSMDAVQRGDDDDAT